MTIGRHFTEHIYADSDGLLRIEELSSIELADRFGTPLYVLSEQQIRHNVRSITRAFRERYPNTVVLFSNKANNNPAVRHIFNQEGAGGDCFGYGELYLSLLAGTDPTRVMLNGSNKQEPELEMAIGAGVTINLDSLEELETVACVAERMGRSARVAPRTRLMLSPLDELVSDWPVGFSVGEGARMHKFGMHFEDVEESCRRALASEWLELVGLHHHIGRWTNDTRMYRVLVGELVDWAARLRASLGWTAGHLDIGGGLAWGRPEGHGPGNHDHPAPDYDAYAEAITDALKEGLARYQLGEPTLMIEPGRALASSIGVLLARVGIVKTWPGVKTWVNIDASQNHLANILTAGWYYHPLAAANANPSDTALLSPVDLVGPLCTFDVMSGDARMPPLQRGDVVAFLDAGAYGETKAATFNAQPRPATVLVNGTDAEVITERETVWDVIGRFRIPPRFLTAAPNDA